MFELARQVVILSLVTKIDYLPNPIFTFAERAAVVMLGLLWLGITGYIFRQYVLEPRRSGGGKRHRSNRKHRTGKRCPQCQNLIDSRRTACQHCGHAFAATPPAPESAKTTGETNRGSRHDHKRGKYCPQCHKLINRERATCQHCGYVFFEARAAQQSSRPQEPSAPEGDGL
jgi:RNA polymerase subunit RPABC4/transcription elongation factor Spt4